MTNETVDNSAQESPENPHSGETARSGLPLRGFAMVLIAVAVMFALWALYAFTQDGGSDNSDNAAKQASEQTSQQSGQAGGAGAAGADGATAPDDASADNPADSAADEPGSKPASEAASEAEPGSAPDALADAGPGAAAGVQAGATAALKVNVLNNSMTQGLAADVSDRLRADGHELGEVGNFADEILPQTTVFFPAGNAEAERTAREIADEFNGVARENIDSLPDNTRDGITVVLTEN